MPNIKYDRRGNVKCRVCSCTEFVPCNPPCGWHDFDLCTTCAHVVKSMLIWLEAAYQPSVPALLRECERQKAEAAHDA